MYRHLKMATIRHSCDYYIKNWKHTKWRNYGACIEVTHTYYININKTKLPNGQFSRFREEYNS